MKCTSCDSEIEDGSIVYSDDKKPVCETCYDEADPIATVVFNNDSNSQEAITDYHNGTPFKIGYHRTDGWRGYYEVEESKGWTKVLEDGILSYSEDEKELKKLDDAFNAYCKFHRIEFAKVFCRSSNVFYSSYELFVKDKDVKAVKELITSLKTQYRDDDRFTSTALTGADPKEQTATDKKFVKAAKKILGVKK